MERKVNVALSPSLMGGFDASESLVVVIDILRATTCICAGLHHGADHIIPLLSVKECMSYKEKGYLIAAERNGVQQDGFDIGNSPYSYMNPAIRGRGIAMTTTNGTKAIHAAALGAQTVIGAFSNMSILTQYIKSQERDVLLLCSGWKDKINLEDTLFAGAMVEALAPEYAPADDSCTLATFFYHSASLNMLAYMRKSSNYKRLRGLNLERDAKHCLRRDTHPVLPVVKGDRIVLQEVNALAG